MLRKYGPFLVTLWGWALLAMANAHALAGVACAVVGVAAGFAQTRFFAVSAVVEGAALVACIAIAPTAQIGWFALGALFVVGARVLSRVARPVA